MKPDQVKWIGIKAIFSQFRKNCNIICVSMNTLPLASRFRPCVLSYP